MRAAGLAKEKFFLGEPFVPTTRNILVSEDGHLRQLMPPPEGATVPQLRPERTKLFREHLHQDYIIKFMSQDTKNAEAVDMIRSSYNVIAIERRNVMSAYLSALIAYQHQVWHAKSEAERPEYHEIVVPRNQMRNIGAHFSRYYQWRDLMNPRVILCYEDIIAQSREATLRQIGLYQEGIEIPESSTIKMHSFQDKAKLIKNLDEVMDHFSGILVAYGIPMVHNDF
jgi:hypothetical protein